MGIAPPTAIEQFIDMKLDTTAPQEVIKEFELTFLLTNDVEERKLDHQQILMTLDRIEERARDDRAMKGVPGALEKYAQNARCAYENEIVPDTIDVPASSEVRLVKAYHIKNTKRDIPNIYAQKEFVNRYLPQLASTGDILKDIDTINSTINDMIKRSGNTSWNSDINPSYSLLNAINTCSEQQFLEIADNYIMRTMDSLERAGQDYDSSNL